MFYKLNTIIFSVFNTQNGMLWTKMTRYILYWEGHFKEPLALLFRR